MEGLEHDADGLAAYCGKPVFARLREIVAGDETWPEVAASRPVITMSSDDFPEPLGPTRATDWPSATERSTPRNISTGPARLLSVSVTSFQSMAGSGPAGED